jgi:hypothetical protein
VLELALGSQQSTPRECLPPAEAFVVEDKVSLGPDRHGERETERGERYGERREIRREEREEREKREKMWEKKIKRERATGRAR